VPGKRDNIQHEFGIRARAGPASAAISSPSLFGILTNKHNEHAPNTYPSCNRDFSSLLLAKRIVPLSVLLHNHPSGDPTPSRADIEMTRQIANAAKPLGIQLYDHVIVGKDGHASMKGLGLM
jgi:hypothetical protein